MCGAVRKSRFIASVSKPVAEAGRAERLTVLRRQERQVLGRRLGDDRGKYTVERDRKLDASLLLADVQHAIADMLMAHSDNVTAPLTRVEQQHQSQARSRSRFVACLKLLNLNFRPSMIAVCFQARKFYADGRVVSTQANLDGVFQQTAVGLEQMTCGKSFF